MSAFAKDILRTVSHSKKRFFSLVAICALGATMLTGLSMACLCLREAAGALYASQGLFDVSVKSTFGLSQADVDELAAVEGVSRAEGGFEEETYTKVDGQRKTVTVKALLSTGMNEPYVTSGRLPEASDEVAVTEKYLKDTGKQVGDELSFEDTEQDDPTGLSDEPSPGPVPGGTYTIVGTVVDPANITQPDGPVAFRASTSSDYTFFVSGEAVRADATYTVAYLSVAGAEGLSTFSDAYEQQVAEVRERVEDLAPQRERARREEVRSDAQAEIDDAQEELDAERADAEAQLNDSADELSDAEAQLADSAAQLRSSQDEVDAGLAELSDAEAQLVDSEAQLTSSQDEVDSGRAEIEAQEQQLADAQAQLDEGRASWEEAMATRAELASQLEQARAGVEQIDAQAPQVEAGIAAIDAQVPDIDAAIAAIDQQMAALFPAGEPAADDPTHDAYLELASQREQLAGLQDQRAQLVAARDELASQREQAEAGIAQLEAGIAQIDQQTEGLSASYFDDQQAQIDSGRAQIEAGRQELENAQAQIDDGLQQLADGRAQIESNRQRLADAQAQIDAGWEAYQEGKAAYEEGLAEWQESKAEADEKIADAQAQIDEARADVEAVELPTWYVRDRSGLGSYSSVDSDASSIEAIARIIPVIFFVVAVLVGLTTATRMVDEERGLIGLYKALGYSKARILSKYVIYTGLAALVGGLIGDVAGFVAIPYVLLYIFRAMYLLPLFSLKFSLAYAVLGVGAFVAGIVGATLLTCRADLRETPASLMQPPAPRAGSRILLERVRPLWRRLSFLDKVTARNLFRYKKRLAMTVFGIMGCTALLVCGFSIKNTVESLAPRQYDQIYRYDLMAATTADDYEACLERLEGSPEVTDIEPIGVDTVTVEHDGAEESMQLYVVPSGVSIESYVTLETLSGEPIDLDEAGIVITNNAATVLGLGDSGGECTLTTSALDKADCEATAVARNYLGNAVYMTEEAYEELFGPLELNGFYAHLTGSREEQKAFADELEADEAFLSVTSVAKMHEQFEQSFTLINVVVYVVIGLAAGLAFVVLFTLSTVNIGEREREIATIKVLGFRAPEVRTYINKETFLLTLMGIVCGLPAGWALSESFTYILKMPSIFFDVLVAPWCYALAAALTVVFALAVSLITNRMLDRVDMVGALKSPE